jgi:hypothetical protein
MTMAKMNAISPLRKLGFCCPAIVIFFFKLSVSSEALSFGEGLGEV